MNELDWETGHRTAWARMLSLCCIELGPDNLEAGKARGLVEREEMRSALRTACEDFGDNDWDDNLSLVDVIDKHLLRHLHRAASKDPTP